MFENVVKAIRLACSGICLHLVLVVSFRELYAPAAAKRRIHHTPTKPNQVETDNMASSVASRDFILHPCEREFLQSYKYSANAVNRYIWLSAQGVVLDFNLLKEVCRVVQAQTPFVHVSCNLSVGRSFHDSSLASSSLLPSSFVLFLSLSLLAVSPFFINATICSACCALYSCSSL